jgi:hypothetical protein
MKIKDITFYRMWWANIAGEKEIKAKVDYKAYEVFKNPALLIENNAFKVAKGRNIYDIIWYQDVHNFAISERLKEALESNGITGWSAYSVMIDGIEGQYYGFWVTGKGGPVTKLDKDGCIPQSKPVEWDTTKWDGSDVFTLEDRGFTVLTPKAVEVFQQFKIKNVDIKPL